MVKVPTRSAPLLRAISHDLRSPLTAIMSAAETIASPRLASEQRRELSAVIVGAGSRLTGLIDNLLDVSRVEAGAVAPREAWCSIEEILDAALEHAPGGRDHFDVALDPALPSVRADAAQLERVFANLLDNASRFAAKEPVRLEAEVAHERLLVRVTDHGPGIPSAERERVFEPFYRAGRADQPGSGLGLAIVKGFVEANGGRVRLESAPDHGASFVVELPIQEREPVAGLTTRS